MSNYPNIQILTVCELLEGRGIDMPSRWRSIAGLRSCRYDSASSKGRPRANYLCGYDSAMAMGLTELGNT